MNIATKDLQQRATIGSYKIEQVKLGLEGFIGVLGFKNGFFDVHVEEVASTER